MISNPATPNPSQLMSKLRMMPDAELFKYAQMHQSDPYIFPLTFQESNARKAMRAAQQMAGVQSPKVVQQDLQQMAPPRPMQAAGLPMAAAGAMGAAQPEQALPEDQGIGQLPAPNMQGMAEGGIVGFDGGGGAADKINYRQYAIDRAKQLGLNPQLVDNIFKTESGYDPTAKSGTGPVGIGQISKFIGRSIFGQRNGIDPDSVGKTNDGRLDPIKNINTSLDFMAHLNQKYKGDPTKVAVAYNQGEPVLDKHLKANDGKVVPSDLPSEARKYISKTLTNLMPFGSANAGEVPRQAPTTTSAIDQIPGQTRQAPPAKNAGITALTGDDNFTDPMTGFSPTQAPVGERPRVFSGEGARQAMLGVGDLPYALAGAPADIVNALKKGLTLGRYGEAEPTLGSAHLKRLATEYLGREAESADPAMRNMRTAGEVAGTFINPVTGLRTAATKTEAGLNALFGAQKAKEAEAVAAAPTKLPPRLTMNEPAIPVNPAGEATASVAGAGGRSVQETQQALEAERLANQARDQLAADQLAKQAARYAEPSPAFAETAKVAAPGETAARATQIAGETATVAPQITSGIPSLFPSSTPAATNLDFGDELERLKARYSAPQAAPEEETPTAEAPAEAPKKGGMDYSDLMLKMGLGLMAGKSPNALTNVGEAGLGALQMTMAEKKAAAEQSYHEALAEQARAHAAYYPGMLAQKMAGLDAKQRVAVETETARLMASYKNNPLYMTNPAALQQMEMSVREGVMNRILGQSQAPTAGAPVTVPQGVTVKQIG